MALKQKLEIFFKHIFRQQKIVAFRRVERKTIESLTHAQTSFILMYTTVGNVFVHSVRNYVDLLMCKRDILQIYHKQLAYTLYSIAKLSIYVG